MIMQDKLFLALMETQAAHWNLARKGFQEMDLSDGQPKVLYILRVMEGCVQKELAEACQIRPSSMTVLLDKMEKQGRIYREEKKVSGGKRAYAIFMTEDGWQLSERIHELVEELEIKSFQGFSEEEKQQTFSLLAHIRENLCSQ